MGTAASSPLNVDILRPPPGYVINVSQASSAAPNNVHVGTTGLDESELRPSGDAVEGGSSPSFRKMDNSVVSGGEGTTSEKRGRPIAGESLGSDDGPLRKRRARESHEGVGTPGEEETGLGNLSHENLTSCTAGTDAGTNGTTSHTLDMATPNVGTCTSVPSAMDGGSADVAAAAAAAAVAAEVTAAANAVDAAFMSFPTASSTDVSMSAPPDVGVDVATAHHVAVSEMAGFHSVSMGLMANGSAAPVSAAVGIAPPPHSMPAVGVAPSTAVLTNGVSPFSNMAGVLPPSYSFLPMPPHGLLNASPVPVVDPAATSAAVSAAVNAVNAAANSVFVHQGFPVAVPTEAMTSEYGFDSKDGMSQAVIAPSVPSSNPTPPLGPTTTRSSGRRKNSETQEGDPPRRNRSRPTCTAEGCQQRPLFGIEGTKQAIFCSQHKAPGMTNVLCRRCEVEGCKHQPSFAVEGSRAVRCATHKTANMVNVAAPRCKSPGCMVCPSFGKQGERKASFCATHRREGDVDLVTRRCHHEGCVHRPVFGHPPEKKAYYCASHKLEGMVNVFAPRCAFPDCTHQPSYGLPGSKRSTHCGKHRTQYHENKR